MDINDILIQPRTDTWTSKTRTKAHIYDPTRPSKLVYP